MKNILRSLILAVLFVLALSSVSAESPDPVIEEFRLTRSTDTPSVTLELLRLGDDWYFCQDAGIPGKTDPALVQDLGRIISQYHMAAWNGFRETEPDVLDGEMFSLFIRFSDGSEIAAYGDNAFPDHYFEATGEIDALLRDIPLSPAGALPGEYCYEGEGFGGDFTITISEDKSFTFTEGYLSSYLGHGEWFQEGARLFLEEGESPFRRFVFMPTVDALFYLADESAAFPYVQAPDHARFNKVSQENGSVIADFTFQSFDGGGPEYSVRIDDPSVLSCTKYHQYDAGSEGTPGASYTVIFTFVGLKPGETRVTVLEKSSSSTHEYPFSAHVDQWGNITLNPCY